MKGNQIHATNIFFVMNIIQKNITRARFLCIHLEKDVKYPLVN